MDKRHHTTLAFVQLDEHGDRSFTFYRDPGADTQLLPEEVMTVRIAVGDDEERTIEID